jgi:alpha,alpha-trehalase
VKSSEPRPESYKEDYINAHESSNVQNYYSNVISAAESGWDFSSRWFNDPMDIKTIAITQILPVDLNAIMLKNEKTLYEFHKLLSSSKEVICFYKKAIDDREEAINECLWDSKLKTWGDLNYATNKLNSTYVYISDLTPLWAGITLKPGVTVEDILLRYRSLLMDYKSGIPASNICSQHQWDFPNVWAPYHLSTVELLLANDKHEMALDIAQRFVNTTYVGWLKSNKQMIFEKYNANNVGVYGEGGEYFVQEGFGWTNGVVIKFLELFGEKLKILGEY